MNRPQSEGGRIAQMSLGVVDCGVERRCKEVFDVSGVAVAVFAPFFPTTNIIFICYPSFCKSSLVPPSSPSLNVQLIKLLNSTSYTKSPRCTQKLRTCERRM